MRIRSWILAASLAGTAVPFVAAPALAECVEQQNVMPNFRHVAPTARRIVIGTVERPRQNYPEPLYWPPSEFDLRISEVVRGAAREVIHVKQLRSGLPLVGFSSCIASAYYEPGTTDAIDRVRRLPPGLSGAPDHGSRMDPRPQHRLLRAHPAPDGGGGSRRGCASRHEHVGCATSRRLHCGGCRARRSPGGRFCVSVHPAPQAAD
jgi:hypothetical protein